MNNEELFSELVRKYSKPLYWKVRQIVIRHEDADDVLQNAFMKAWTKIGDFRGESNLQTWLYRICVNEALDFLRKKREMLSNDGEMKMADKQFTDDYFDGNETQIKLFKAIETLQKHNASHSHYDTLTSFRMLKYHKSSALLKED